MQEEQIGHEDNFSFRESEVPEIEDPAERNICDSCQ